jgi:hypothetical protein
VSSVLGIDLSTRQLDLAYVDENHDTVQWRRLILQGSDAWARTLELGALRHDPLAFDGVYLVAIEAPYGSGQPGTQALLNRVVGAIAASLPTELRAPERCWIVRPDEWKQGLGLTRKPTARDVAERLQPVHGWDRIAEDQNALDAACLALWARNTNHAAITAAYQEGAA